MRVPLGVIGFIYESRPNVTADAAGLCVKSGNAVLLRGGSEAIESNTLHRRRARQGAGEDGRAAGRHPVPRRRRTARRSALMLEQDRYLDLVIPRGGEEFVRWVAEHSRVPVLKHDKGLVHVFVDAGADLDMATAIVLNAKTQRPSVCNALETLLVDGAVAARFLPAVAARLAEAGVELRGCPRTRRAGAGRRGRPPRRTGTRSTSISSSPSGSSTASTRPSRTSAVTAPGWRRPSSPTISRARGASRARWTRRACSSTRPPGSLDGNQFGMGAEMGISTSRVHARGPVGVRELTTTKFVVQGDGQVRD